MDGAGVELQPEHRVSVGTVDPPVVAFHLQGAAEGEGSNEVLEQMWDNCRPAELMGGLIFSEE